MTDRQIIDLYREGSCEKAFNLIVEQYTERLYWHIRRFLCNHEDVNDLLQDVFIKIWAALPSFRGEAKLYTWLYRIAANEAVTFLNRKRLYSFFSPGTERESESRMPAADPYFNGSAVEAALQREILKLPPKQRAIFNLRYFQETKFSEIAQIMGRSEGAVKASYHLAYTKIKKNLLSQF